MSLWTRRVDDVEILIVILYNTPYLTHFQTQSQIACGKRNRLEIDKILQISLQFLSMLFIYVGMIVDVWLQLSLTYYLQITPIYDEVLLLILYMIKETNLKLMLA